MPIRIIILSFLSITVFSQCKAPYKLRKQAPFTITEATYQDWVGGQIGNSGTIVSFFISDTKEAIQPDSLYFHNRVTAIDIKPAQKGRLWVANFRTEIRKNPALNNHPVAISGEPVPEMKNFPFKLEKDEAVLGYTLNNKVYYYKISGIKQKEKLFYPAARPAR